jgi:choline-sulfatase
MHYDRNRRYGFEEVFPHRGNSKPLSGGTSRRAPDDDRISHQQWTARSATFRTVPDSQPFRADPSVSECDAYVTAQAVAFLREHAHDREPFFLLVGYHAPHFPLDVPESYFNTFRGRVPMPRIGPETWASMPPHYRHRNSIHGVTASIPPELIRRGRECYWALVRWLDDQIGMLLKAAAGLSAADNTVIVYTTDHGENKGDHGMWWKLCMYEHAARVPLLVRWPRRWPGGQRRRGACTLVDLARAVLDLGGAQQPENWDGASLLPWLDDPAYPWRDVAVSECYGDNISGYSMIRRGRFKYVYFTRPTPHAQPHRQLFDIEADPDEAVNLADRPEHAATIARLHADLVAEVGRDPEEIERLARMAARTKEKPPLNAAL